MQFTQFELKALRDALVAGIQDLDNEIAIDSPYARFAEGEVKLMRNLLEKISKGIKKGGE